ncbi:MULTISPECIES: helix-turn-helix domain-containing protein [Staphylococcus]|uniref:Helix-turn-helix transcriptional regulator n=1 Tax=Staphylococcus equorum TaxID=246432 RepID=A0AAW7AHN5_9STAP|nr:helix-turn-helix transcriptional regulator [Staphylococcus equorum]MDK9865165.1 helix-turn-helix transcriptional regulator [Staphylococcus equorum]
MSLMNMREATGLSIVELSNRIASLYNTKLSPELIERIESNQAKLKNEDAQILAEFFNTTSEDLM